MGNSVTSRGKEMTEGSGLGPEKERAGGPERPAQRLEKSISTRREETLSRKGRRASDGKASVEGWKHRLSEQTFADKRGGGVKQVRPRT